MEIFNIHALLQQTLIGKEILLYVYVKDGRESNCLESSHSNKEWVKSHNKWAKISEVVFSDGGEWDPDSLSLEIEGGELFNFYLSNDITVR